MKIIISFSAVTAATTSTDSDIQETYTLKSSKQFSVINN